VPKKKIESVLKRHAGTLMAISGVNGIAIGKLQGKYCITVYVVQKTSELLQQIPSDLEGYTVTIQESGEFRALGT
jgi:hypothetical protein